MTHSSKLPASFRLARPLTVLLGLLILGADPVPSQTAERDPTTRRVTVDSGQATFGSWAVHGFYGFSFDGTVYLPNPSTGEPAPVPVSAVGWFRADGRGNFTEAVRTLNFGGQVFHQTAVGTYDIDRRGFATSVFQVFDRDSGVLVSEERFQFVVDSNRQEIQAIATGLTSFLFGPEGVELPVVVRISVHRQ